MRSIDGIRLFAGACSLALLTGCVIPVGTTYSRAPVVEPAAPAATAATGQAEPAAQARAVRPAAPATTTTAEQIAPAVTAPVACAPDEIRVASGECRPRSLYAGGGGGGSGGGGGGSSGGGGGGSGGGGGGDSGGGWQ
jgi:hypothetical protein